LKPPLLLSDRGFELFCALGGIQSHRPRDHLIGKLWRSLLTFAATATVPAPTPTARPIWALTLPACLRSYSDKL